MTVSNPMFDSWLFTANKTRPVQMVLQRARSGRTKANERRSRRNGSAAAANPAPRTLNPTPDGTGTGTGGAAGTGPLGDVTVIAAVGPAQRRPAQIPV